MAEGATAYSNAVRNTTCEHDPPAPFSTLCLNRSAIGLEQHEVWEDSPAPALILTSPPYPGVHVLYHRWQVQGRRETPAPYWIAQVPDGHFASHYTGGSRTPTGELRYFSMIRNVFSSVRPHMADDGLVAQLVGFADVESQLPLYLAAMSEAGFQDWTPPSD